MEDERIRDATCPQCGQSYSESTEDCSHCGFGGGTAEEPSGDTECSSGARLAGGILVVFGLTALLGVALGGRGGEVVNPLGPALVDIWIGFTLLKGSRRFLGFAKFRVIAGAILYTGIAVVHQDPFSAVFQLVFSLTLCGLLFGTAGTLRKTLALVVAVPVMALSILGIQQNLTGHNALTSFIQRIQFRTESTEGKVIRGSVQGYSFGPLPSPWRLMDPEQARELNPVVDLWLLDSGRDASIQVIPEHLGFSDGLDLAAFEEVVLDNLRKVASDVEKLSGSELTLNNSQVRILDAVAVTESLKIRYRFGLFLQDDMAIQVVCFTSEASFKNVESDFLRAIESLVTEELKATPFLPKGPTDSVA